MKAKGRWADDKYRVQLQLPEAQREWLREKYEQELWAYGYRPSMSELIEAVLWSAMR